MWCMTPVNGYPSLVQAKLPRLIQLCQKAWISDSGGGKGSPKPSGKFGLSPSPLDSARMIDKANSLAGRLGSDYNGFPFLGAIEVTLPIVRIRHKHFFHKNSTNILAVVCS
jgi:hypothetical protein